MRNTKILGLTPLCNRDGPCADASRSAYWDVNVDRAPVRCAEVGTRCVKIGLLLIVRTDPSLEEANRRTLQRDLKGLLDAGLLTTKGATHQLVYSLNQLQKSVQNPPRPTATPPQEGNLRG